MKTLGIDLASDPKLTGVCVVEWRPGSAEVVHLGVGADDDSLLELHERVDVTGIDSPFGWPVAFEDMIRGAPSCHGMPWTPEWRNELRFRATDRLVRKLMGRWPLSVSSDLIAVPAFRCSGLLERMGVRDRSGDGRVYETYPASALKVWGLPSTGYKGTKGHAAREKLWHQLESLTPWLSFNSDVQPELLSEKDDALDALVAALIARAAKLGLTVGPEENESDPARTEGWIHVPVAGSLGELAEP